MIPPSIAVIEPNRKDASHLKNKVDHTDTSLSVILVPNDINFMEEAMSKLVYLNARSCLLNKTWGKGEK